jgi:hypothetical protein
MSNKYLQFINKENALDRVFLLTLFSWPQIETRITLLVLGTRKLNSGGMGYLLF